MQGIKIAGEIVFARERTRARIVVRVMAGNRQVSEKKPPALRQRINPIQHPLDRGWLIHAEAGLAFAAYVAGVFQRLETAMVNDLLHAQIQEATGMKQRRSITLCFQSRGKGWRGDLRADLRLR